MALTAKDDCNTSSTATDLTVTDRTLGGWQDCGSMFDNVKRITIQVWDTIRCDVIQRIHLSAVTELTIQTHEYARWPASLHDNPTSLPNVLASQLVKVTFRDLKIGNDQAKRITQAFRSTHDIKHLRILGFVRCGTDERLDRSIIDSDDEHKIIVEIVHGKPVGIKKTCGRNGSDDLADFMRSSSTLRSAWIAISSGQGEDMHDNLSAVLAHNATHSKIEYLEIKCIDLSQRPSALRDLAQFICKMPNLRKLSLRGKYGDTNPSLHEEFYSTLSSLASSAKIECLEINYINLSKRQSASRDLAQFICKMPNLRKLCLGDKYGITSPSLHEEFYPTLSSLASSAKIERLEIRYIDLSQRLSTSRDLAQFICKMPNLRELCLGDRNARPSLHEEFYSTLSSLAPSAKVSFPP
nr:uncharacterized protein LOC129259249 [Lytechinus pictus]